MGLEPDPSVRRTPDLAPSAALPRPSRNIPTSSPLSNLSAIVLLSGSVRSTDFVRSIGRSVLDLPLEQNTTILQRWRDEALALATSINKGPLELRVTLNRHSVAPNTPDDHELLRVSVAQDPQDYRGTAGLLRDVSLHDDEDSYLLVANGNQIPLEPLDVLAHDLADRGGDIALIAHDDGAPMGVMLVRVGAIRGLRELGYMDFKEQVLPNLAEQFDVRVVTREHATGLPVRTLDAYIAALTTYHKRLAGKPTNDEAGSEQWFSTFSIIEDDALVAASARIHDSVILKGARVGANAVVVRSIVTSTAVIKPGLLAADRVVDRSTDLSARGSA